MGKASENTEKIVTIEAFYAVERIEEKRKRAVRTWSEIVKKVITRRDFQWTKAA